jgi:uracil-DNA glycosylase family 4
MDQYEHYCENVDGFPTRKFLQEGRGLGKRVLIVGEAPANNGWRKSGRAFYTTEGKLLPSGRNLNELLKGYGLSVENCGFTELVKCYVGKDRQLLSSCGEKTWPIFLKQLKSQDFLLVIILGVKTLEIFNKLSGLNLRIGELKRICLDRQYYNFLPIFHPSPISPHSRSRNEQIFKSLDRKLRELLPHPATIR